MLAMMMTVHTNSMDVKVAVLNNNDSDSKHHSSVMLPLLQLLPMVVAYFSLCQHLNCHHCHIGNNHCCAIVGYNSHWNSCRPACDSWHNAHLDPSSESMAVPRKLAVQISGDDDCSAVAAAVAAAVGGVSHVFASNRCCFRVLDDGILLFFFWIFLFEK